MVMQRLSHNLRWVAGLAFALLLCAGTRAKAAETFQPIPLSALPDFSQETEGRVSKSGLVHLSGYIATINVEEFPTEELDGGDSIKLRREVTGFKDEFKIRAKWQRGKAPLAVILPGLYGKADDKMGRHWQSLLYQSGCHVMCFDSIFRSDVNKRTGLGVPGNLKAEADVLAKLITLALDYRKDKKSESVRSLITSVRLFGTSYGGALALQVARTEAAKQWPLDRCLAISPPPRMRSTAELVEQFQRLDLPKYGGDLMKLMGGYTPKDGMPTEAEEGLARAGISYVFGNALKNVVKDSGKRYMGDLRDRLQAEEQANPTKPKLSGWDNWTFEDFVDRMAAPYWKLKPDELWRYGDLAVSLDGAPAFVQVVLAADDPLAKPTDIQALKQRYPEPKLIVLPHGGHMGYSGTHWLKALIGQTFKP